MCSITSALKLLDLYTKFMVYLSDDNWVQERIYCNVCGFKDVKIQEISYDFTEGVEKSGINLSFKCPCCDIVKTYCIGDFKDVNQWQIDLFQMDGKKEEK